MKTQKKPDSAPPQSPTTPAPAANAEAPARRSRWRVAAWGLGIVLAAGLVFVAVWSLISPPIPPVHLSAEADPALVSEVSRARWAIRFSPFSDKPWGHMAMLLQAHGLDAEARAFYTQAEQLNPNEPRWPYLHSAILSDDPRLAIDLLRRSTELCANQPGAPDAPLVRLGDLCLDNELVDEAEQAYDKLLQLRPDHPRAHLGLARVAVVRSEPRKALPHLQTCLNSPEVRREAHLVLAEVHQRCGDRQAAAQAAQEAEKLPKDAGLSDPWAAEVRQLLVGRTAQLRRMAELQGQGRRQEAISLEIRTALEEYPDIGLVRVGWGQFQQGRLSDAEKTFRDALKFNPSSVDALYLLGRVLYARKRFAAARDSFRRVTELDVKNGSAYREWGRCALALGERSEAKQQLRQAIKYVPHDADAHAELGAVLLAEGDRKGAMLHLGQAVQLNPHDQQRARELLDEARKGRP